MEIVTKFETAAPQVGDFGSYEEVLFALRYQQGVAENVYAKRAKHDLRNAIALPVLMAMQSDIEETDLPIWVDQHTVVIPESTFPTEKPDRENPVESHAGKLLRKTTERLVSSILLTLKDVLIDPLWTRVQQVSGGAYSFTVKQRWATKNG